MAAEPTAEQDVKKIFEDIDAYPFDSDAEFQGGLTAILGPNASSSAPRTQELTLRARLFYYARKKNIPPINFDAYKAHLASKPSPPTDETPPYPTPFAEIVALITSGRPIPGIKDIPPTVLPEKATQPAASRRKKPWEKDGSLTVEQSTFGDRRDDAIIQDLPGESAMRYAGDEL